MFKNLLINLLIFFCSIPLFIQATEWNEGTWNSGLHISNISFGETTKDVTFSWTATNPEPEYGYTIYLKENNKWRYGYSTKNKYITFKNIGINYDVVDFIITNDITERKHSNFIDI